MQTTHASDHQPQEKTWLVIPAVSVAIGIAYLLAGWLGGNLGFGIFGLALMSAVALVLVLVRGRSETIRGLLDRRDERINAIDVSATTFAGGTVLVVTLVAFIVQVARGVDPWPFAWLCAIGGVAYVAAVVYLAVRR